MTFPQFISGSSGRLTFNHLNEIFDRIEKLERKPNSLDTKMESTEIFAARVLAVSGQQASFVQVMPSATAANNWTDVPLGIRSSDGSNQFAFPIIDANLAGDEIVFLTPANAPDGTEIFLVVRAKQDSATFAAIITGSAALTGSATLRKAWKYTIRKVTTNASSTNITYAGTGNDLFAYNGAENNTDTTTVFGVGMKPDVTPVSPTLVRQAIKTNTVVVVTRQTDGTNIFSMPNGYEVTCP